MIQPDFAVLGGVTKRALINYEKGERNPDAKFLAAIAGAGADVLYILTGQRSAPVAPQSLLPAGDRVLLDNFHAAPEQVQAGIKQTLGAFASASDRLDRRGKKGAA